MSPLLPLALLLFGASFATGAAGPSGAVPQYGDPFEKLLPAALLGLSPIPVPEDQPFLIRKPACYTVSENASKSLDYLRSNGIEPAAFLRRLMTPIRKNFSFITLVDDLRSARSSHKATTLLTDLQVKLGAREGEPTWVEGAFYFLDEHQVPKVRYRSRIEEVLPYPVTKEKFESLAARMAEDLNNKISLYVTKELSTRRPQLPTTPAKPQ